jgi:NAD+ kinase
MSTRFRHAALVGKYQAQGIGGLLDEVAQFMVRRGLEVTLERDTALHTGLAGYATLDAASLGRDCDVVVAVGGDGTMLGIARQVARHGTPLIGINQGRLGFITDVSIDGFGATLGPMLEGDYEEERRTMLAGSVQRDGHGIFESFALNDVVVGRGAAASQMVELRVDIDGDFVANLRCDGLIVASPTGSTAYALSAGGPILHPAVSSWVLAPIAPHDLSNRPIVVPDSGTISVEIVSGREVNVSFDMQSLASLLHGDRVHIRRSKHQVRFLHPRGWSYYATLRRKLRWYGGVPPASG